MKLLHNTAGRLMLAGSLLIGAGIALVLLIVFAPDSAPAIHLTDAWTRLPTPTLAVWRAPVQPPAAPAQAARVQDAVVLVLPVMPVQAEAIPTADESSTPTLTDTPRPTSTGTPQATAAATLTITPSPMPSITPSGTPSVTATTSPTATGTPTPALTPVPPQPERLLIPVLDVDAPIVPVGWHTVTTGSTVYGQWDVPSGYAIGWHQTSARAGEPGNTVLNGHHNIEGEVFGGLVDLTPGDRLILTGGGRSYRYIVAQIMVLPESGEPLSARLANAQWIQPSGDERLTLVTCWPATGNSHRLIVVALPVDAPGGRITGPPPD
jgi:LPXTG-site transpeptidase (sortase) family protein